MSTERQPRFVSQLTRETLALILAGGKGTRLKELTTWRAKPAVPFAGKFRIIDFTLSNCMNSGVRRIGVVTQYKAYSLIRHIQKGWGFLRGEFNEFVELLPAQQRITSSWYSGTADAVYQNLDIVRSHRPSYVMVLAGDHIYKMDYGPMLAHHARTKADLTVGCVEVPLSEASSFGVVTIDEEARIRRFVEKPEHPEPMPGKSDTVLASMGIYVFSTDFLIEQMIRDADSPGSSHDFGKDVIPNVIDDYRVMAYSFRDADSGKHAYWRDVGTIDAFWEANLELTGLVPELNLYDDEWPIWTYQEQLPPAKFVHDQDGRRGMAVDSLVSGGCIISGSTVRRSLLFSSVVINERSLVEDSVILPEVRIGAGCIIRRAVIDKGCVLPDGFQVGLDPEMDAQRYSVSPGGVALVTPDMLGQRRHHAR